MEQVGDHGRHELATRIALDAEQLFGEERGGRHALLHAEGEQERRLLVGPRPQRRPDRGDVVAGPGDAERHPVGLVVPPGLPDHDALGAPDEHTARDRDPDGLLGVVLEAARDQ